MELLISISKGRAIDKYRAEKMFNLMARILEGEKIDIEGSPFVECANYVRDQDDMTLFFVLLGEDASPISPARCIVLNDLEEIVFDPDEAFRTQKAKYVTEPMYYKIDEKDRRKSKEVPYYIVSRRQAREIIE